MIKNRDFIFNHFVKELVRLEFAFKNNLFDLKSDYDKRILNLKNLSSEVDLNEFKYLINRHSVISFLAKSKVIISLNPEFLKIVKFLFKKQLINSLKLFQLTKEINQSLKAENIKFLIIKGIPLSHQVFGNLEGRGKSIDVDVLVDLKQLSKFLKLW